MTKYSQSISSVKINTPHYSQITTTAAININAGLIFMRLFLIRMGWPSFISLHDALQQTNMSLLDICSVQFNSVALYFRALDPVFRIFMQKRLLTLLFAVVQN